MRVAIAAASALALGGCGGAGTVAAGPEAALKSLATLLKPAEDEERILYLVSDESKYITGVPLPVDAGFVTK